MAKPRRTAKSAIARKAPTGPPDPPEREEAASTALARKGITTSLDFANFSGALMCDTVLGRIKPTVTTATCIAGRQLLKVIEMQLKYGQPDGKNVKALTLCQK